VRPATAHLDALIPALSEIQAIAVSGSADIVGTDILNSLLVDAKDAQVASMPRAAEQPRCPEFTDMTDCSRVASFGKKCGRRTAIERVGGSMTVELGREKIGLAYPAQIARPRPREDTICHATEKVQAAFV